MEINTSGFASTSWDSKMAASDGGGGGEIFVLKCSVWTIDGL